MRTTMAVCLAALMFTVAHAQEKAPRDLPGTVHCANLVYAGEMTSKCFADHFLADARKITNVNTAEHFSAVRVDSHDLFDHPFAVMSGEGAFELSKQELDNLRAYLTGGGFLVASPGCSSADWNASFRKAIAAAFPDHELVKLGFDHPIFHTAYDIDRLETKRRSVEATLEGLSIDGRIVLVYSPEGLNDTANAGGGCCCCGGNEVLNARKVNVNLLTYALTH